MTPDERIEALDLRLFDQVPTETSSEDRTSLLLLQRAVRRRGPYAYLEIGSHLGGTIEPHYVDPRCLVVYAIDKRLPAQPDERGRSFDYPHNSTERMRKALAVAFPEADAAKVVSFDCDASEVAAADLTTRPALCLIDGEHTTTAVRSDFESCVRLAGAGAVVAFHDACYVFEGIQAITRRLDAAAASFRGYLLAGSVYVILLGHAVETFAGDLAPHARDKAVYFRESRRALRWERLKNALERWPLAAPVLRAARRTIAGNLTRRDQ